MAVADYSQLFSIFFGDTGMGAKGISTKHHDEP
jgi:hypothetical protein